jgi:uncharacterized membrane protein
LVVLASNGLQDKEKVKPLIWFGIIVIYTALTLLCVYLIPNDSPLIVFTYFFGFTFVAAVPGYCLISLLFQEGKLDLVETAVLSVALSFSIAAISGLFLGLSPIRITVQSITFSLSGIVFGLALLTFLKKMGMLQRLRLHSPKPKSENSSAAVGLFSKVSKVP